MARWASTLEKSQWKGKFMSNAKEILDERLAKGEISEQEYDRLKQRLATSFKSNGSQANAQTSKPMDLKSEAKSAMREWAKVFLLFGAMGVVFTIWAAAETGGLNDLGQSVSAISPVLIIIGALMFFVSGKR